MNNCCLLSALDQLHLWPCLLFSCSQLYAHPQIYSMYLFDLISVHILPRHQPAKINALLSLQGDIQLVHKVLTCATYVASCKCTVCLSVMQISRDNLLYCCLTRAPIQYREVTFSCALNCHGEGPYNYHFPHCSTVSYIYLYVFLSVFYWFRQLTLNFAFQQIHLKHLLEVCQDALYILYIRNISSTHIVGQLLEVCVFRWH